MKNPALGIAAGRRPDARREPRRPRAVPADTGWGGRNPNVRWKLGVKRRETDIAL